MFRNQKGILSTFDCVLIKLLEKLVLDTVRLFSYKIKEAGKDAKMDKTIIKDAFRNVPATVRDLRLRRLQIQSRYFLDLQMIFGAKRAIYALQGGGEHRQDARQCRVGYATRLHIESPVRWTNGEL